MDSRFKSIQFCGHKGQIKHEKMYNSIIIIIYFYLRCLPQQKYQCFLVQLIEMKAGIHKMDPVKLHGKHKDALQLGVLIICIASNLKVNLQLK